jgi:hypothetical protein
VATKKVAKTAVKKATKKAPAKKTAVKKSAKKELQYADETKTFWLTDGQILNSLLALRDALDAMEDEVYQYHVKNEHNDFANWVGAVLCDEDCAKDLQKAKTPKSAKTIIVRHLKYYTV